MSLKSYDNTSHDILARTCNVICDNVAFSIEIMSTFKTIKSSLNRSYDNPCPFHMNFMKQAFGELMKRVSENFI